MVEANATLSIATFLNPRLKKLACAQVLNANQCEKQLLAEMESVSVQSDCQYLQLKLLNRKEDPLEWWEKKNKSLLNQLYVLASKYLCIPATSVTSERLFSKVGELVSARSRIKEKT